MLGCNLDLGFLRVFLCTIVSPYFIVKSLQLHGRRQIAKPRKYCLVRVIVFFGMCFLYLFCFSQVGILVKFPTGTSEILSIFLKYLNLPNLPLNLTHNVKLRDVLPEKVMMGFSATTGGGVPVQAIRSWNFSSTLDLGSTQNGGKGSFKMWLIGLIIGLVLLVVGLSFGYYILGRNSKRKVVEEYEDLIEGTGPKMFAYKDLVVATNNFSEEVKLGQGGFESDYKGFLAKMNMEIAVKKISSNSNRGKKEYISEVKTIY